MPRENRKRGKKHKKQAADNNPEEATHTTGHADEQPQAGPSWIVPQLQTPEFNAEAPFGYVDAEVKAYFRTVDVQIRAWQEGHLSNEDGDADPNEDRRLFFVAALTEMSGKEKELSTDPDCSNILERMAYSMDDFARRVFMDRLTGSYKTLVKHRFASHVCQTFIEVAADTIARECQGVLPPASQTVGEGELLLMKDLILDISDELLPDLPSLVMDPFASHVLRALLAVLAPDLFPPDHKSNIRSKKSVAHKARQGSRTSVFEMEKRLQSSTTERLVPSNFRPRADKFTTALRDVLGPNEVRALAASPVASPLLQMLLEIETSQELYLEADSLSDRVLDGLITHALGENQTEGHAASDYVGTLLRDPTSSHLLETLVARLRDDIFSVVWSTYFQGQLSRLAVHPVANFVVAKAFERASKEQLGEACREVNEAAVKIYKSSRTGVFRAILERAGSLAVNEEAVLEMICSAAGISLTQEGQGKAVVPCLMRLMTAEEYEEFVRSRGSSTKTELPNAQPRRRGQAEASEEQGAVRTQGAVLLQSMLKLPSPHNSVVLDSIFAQPIEELIAMAQDATSSRVLDAILQSSTVPLKYKRRLVMNLIGHYHTLVDDRIGSRVGDNCWAFADPYLKEKIARSVIPHERTLAGSFYGKFFLRHLNLHLLKRDSEQWKASQADTKMPHPAKTGIAGGASQVPHGSTVEDTAVINEQVSSKHKKKRKARPDDEIEQLFESKLGKKPKKAALATLTLDPPPGTNSDAGDTKRRNVSADGGPDGLRDIMGAIKAAPKGDDGRRTKKKSKS
ncbi:ARM repeat-containing protein [Trametopsis cervina]|nr:ARM repeat-containing protein [Trametopsis cervina]